MCDLTFTWRNLKTTNQQQPPSIKENKLIEQIGGCQRWEVGEMGEEGQRYKLKSWGCVMYSMVTTVNSTIESTNSTNLKVAKRVDLKSFHKKKIFGVVTDVN